MMPMEGTSPGTQRLFQAGRSWVTKGRADGRLPQQPGFSRGGILVWILMGGGRLTLIDIATPEFRNEMGASSIG